MDPLSLGIMGGSIALPLLFQAIAAYRKSQQPLITPQGQGPSPTATPTVVPTSTPTLTNVLGSSVKFIPSVTPTTAPLNIVNSTSSGEVTGNIPLQLGRSDKAKSAIKANPEKYKQFQQWLSETDANELEKNLATDIAAQESMLDPTLKNYKYPISTSRGLFMYNDPTWGDYQKGIGNTGVSQDVGKDQLDAFLHTIRKGITGQGVSRWNASKDVWGKHYSDDELKNFVK